MGSRRTPWQKAALLLGLTWLAVLALTREDKSQAAPVKPHDDEAPRRPSELERERGAVKPRVLATAFVGIVLFAAGATLGGALTASADEGVALADISGTTIDENTGVDATTDATTTEATSTEQAPEPGTTTEAGEEPPPPPATSTSADEGTAIPPAPPHSGNGGGASGGTIGSDEGGEAAPVIRHRHRHGHRQPPETSEGGAAIIWLHVALPDPTPPARRLAPEFAQSLRATALAYGVRWSVMLAVLRADGHAGRIPADVVELDALGLALANDRVNISKKIRAIARYNRAVGLGALVTGLEQAKPRLAKRILRDSRIEIYAAGRSDIAAGRIDIRVLVALRYLVVRFHEVGVSSLVSGHRLFARPGVISAHIGGLAVDVSSLAGIPISGHQERRSITERAVRALLRLPSEVQPQQIISLLGLGGASFPLADHDDHIHIGF
jgi:hypothetical protein